MTKDIKANITITGAYPSVHYSFDGDNINATTGDLDLSNVSGDVNLKFKIKSSGFSFYVPPDGDAPLEIGTNESDRKPANDWTGEFNSYSKQDSQNLKIKDQNNDGTDYVYSLAFTDGTNHWTLDPMIKNSSNAKL